MQPPDVDAAWQFTVISIAFTCILVAAIGIIVLLFWLTKPPDD